MEESAKHDEAGQADTGAARVEQGPIPRTGPSVAGPSGPSAAIDYWSQNLDPQNLDRRPEERVRIPLRDELVFASTPDLEAARNWLLRARRAPGCVLDLGAGLGSASLVFARRGSWVISVDTSLDRLRELKNRAAEAGCAESVTLIAAAAEALPFADSSLPAVFTKSVLIHTNLAEAVGEISRILSPGGRAAFIEPQPGNPFAWLYRRTLAPKAWRSITQYFDRPRQRHCLQTIGRGRVRPFYLFAFMAFAFQFAWPNLVRFSRALRVLHRFDRWVFRNARWTRRLAWFGLVEAEKPGGDEGLTRALRR